MAAVVKNGNPIFVGIVLKNIQDIFNRSVGAFHHFAQVCPFGLFQSLPDVP
jgi:hypothetical protein